MECPKCKSKNIEVIDTRASDMNSVRRRRICRNCDHRFTTYELTIPEIIKNNNQIRDTLMNNLISNSEKIFSRPITTLEQRCKFKARGLDGELNEMEELNEAVSDIS